MECNRKLFQTKQNIFFQSVAYADNKHFTSTQNKSADFGSSSAKILKNRENDPVNCKLIFLMQKLLSLEKYNFRTVWLELCNVARRQLNLIKNLMRLNPILGARVLFSRNDISAVFEGDAITIVIK